MTDDEEWIKHTASIDDEYYDEVSKLKNIFKPVGRMNREEYRRMRHRELRKWWDTLKDSAIGDAEQAVINRLEAEYDHAQAEEAEEQRIEQEKLAEKQRKLQDAAEEQQRAIEAEEAKWRPRRFDV